MQKFQGGCHCGAVRFEVKADPKVEKVQDCNCSMCAMKGIYHLVRRSLESAGRCVLDVPRRLCLRSGSSCCRANRNSRPVSSFACAPVLTLTARSQTHSTRASPSTSSVPSAASVRCALLAPRCHLDHLADAFYRPRSHPKDFDVNVKCIDNWRKTDWIIEPFDGANW